MFWQHRLYPKPDALTEVALERFGRVFLWAEAKTLLP
jgi:hypothetical protein